MKLGIAGINFFKWRSIAIAAVVTLLLISSQYLTSCLKNDDSIQYLKVAGSCNRQTSITLIDESDKSVEKDAFLNLYKVRRKLFKKYATTISQYIFAKIDAMDQCQSGWMSEPEVELIFVYRPLVGKVKFDSLANFDANKSSDTRILDSPWVKMRIDKSSKLVVRAVFFWNERQFLFDQAVMSGAIPTSTQPLMPLHVRVLGSYYENYHRLLSAASKDLIDGKLSDEEYKQARSKAQVEILKRTPVDIVWLFSYGISMPEDRVVITELNETLGGLEKQYYALNKSLLNARFVSLQLKYQYNNILDLNPIFNIDTYRYTSH